MGNPSDFIIDNGVLKKYVGPGGDVTIPEGVTSIGTGSFSGCSKLELITIPKSVEYIGESAFRNCCNLKSVIIPEGVVEIKPRTFGGCSSITKIIIPENIENIGYGAFEGCRSLSEIVIPKNVATIGDSAFFGCKSLKSISLPVVTNLGERLFTDCDCIVRVQHWSKMLDNAFKGCDRTRILTEDRISDIPSNHRLQALLGFVEDESADITSERAASYFDYAKKFSGKMVRIAFEYPALLTFLCEHILIKVKDIDLYTEEAEKREDPEKKALLLDYQNRIGLEKIKKARHKKEKKIEDYANALAERIEARDPNKGIEGMTFVITGRLLHWKSREELQDYLSFYGANLGSTVNKDTDYLVTNDASSDSEKNKAAKYYGTQVISEIDFNEMVGWRYPDTSQIVIPSWLRLIPKEAFRHCKKLTDILIPSSITAIGEKAFEYCENLRSITIPENVTSIQAQTFHGCKNLADVTLPQGLTGIDYGAFSECVNLSAIEIPDNVTTIGGSAFENCRSLVKATIPMGVKEIGRNTFSGCNKLENIVISGSMTTIGALAFLGCRSLKTIRIPNSVTDIDDSAFESCDSLTEIDVANENLFYCNDCLGVLFTKDKTTVVRAPLAIKGDYTIPDGVVFISDHAFSGCDDLSGLNIPSSVNEIGNHAFEGCSSLVSVTIPEGVKTIGDRAFSGSFNLKEIFLPESLDSIGEEAISNCFYLEKIVIRSKKTHFGSAVFDDCDSLKEIIAPTKSSVPKKYEKLVVINKI